MFTLLKSAKVLDFYTNILEIISALSKFVSYLQTLNQPSVEKYSCTGMSFSPGPKS
jgi:hypothetical protein